METWPAKLAIGALLVTILPWQYGVYMAGKVIVFLVAIYYLYEFNKQKTKSKYFWFVIAVAILYNPLLPVYLYLRFLWVIAGIIAIGVFYKVLQEVRVLSNKKSI